MLLLQFITDKGRTSPFSRPSSAKLVKSSPVVNHRLLSNSSKLSDELELPINTSAVSNIFISNNCIKI